MTSHNSTPPGKYGEFFIWNHIKLKILGEDDRRLYAMYPSGEVAFFAHNDSGEWRRVSNLPETTWPRGPECGRIKMQDQYHVNGDTWYDRYEYTIEVFKDGKWEVVVDGFDALVKHMAFIDEFRKRDDIKQDKRDQMLDHYYGGLLEQSVAGALLRECIFNVKGVVLNVEIVAEAAMTYGASIN